MKRLTAAVAAIGLVATGAVVTVSGAASAAPTDLVNLTVTPPPSNFDGYGYRKAIVTWDEYQGVGVVNYQVVASPKPDFGPDSPGTLNVGKVPVGGDLALTATGLLAGKDYYFAVYALDDNDGVVSPPATDQGTPIGYKRVPGFNLSIKTSRSTVLSGKVIELSGTLTSANGSPLANKTITIFRDPYPKSVERDIKPIPVTTGKGGKWTFKTKPRINGRYWARYIPSNGLGGWTQTVAIDVRAAISLKVRPDTTILAGRELIFRGQVSGRPSLVVGSKICWQSTAGGSWGGGSCGKIRKDASYVLRLKPGAKADGKYRVYSTDLAPYYVASRSRSVKITIR